VSRRRGSWRRALTAVVTAAAGLTTIAGQLSEMAFTGRAARSGLPLLPLHALGIAGGLGLLALAAGLWRGRRRAAVLSTVALCLIGTARLAYGQPALDAAIDLAGGILIALNLGAFPAADRRDRRGRTDALALAAGAGLYALYAVAAIVTANGTEIDRAVTSIGREVPAGPLLAGTPGHLGLVVNAIVAAIVVAGWMLLRALLRPAASVEGHSAAERSRAAAIVRDHGVDSLDPFALRDDKAFHFAAGGFLTYRVLRETAVVSGDPIGPAGSAPAILQSFARFADERGWNVVITAASERHLDACMQLGMRVLRIGDEAVVDPRTFSLEGRPIRKVRQSIARVRRHGWRVEVADDREISPQLERELAEVEEDWRARQKRLIGFAMTLGRLAGAGERNGGIYVLARDPEGRLRSFLSFAPYRGGLSLDLMRRGGDEPNGLTEAMVVAAIECARERGLAAVSLNFAGFAHVMAADAALSRSQRLLRRLLRLFHGRFQLERLVRFNAKFFPRWQPRYLVYDGLAYLPLSALRVLQAEAYLPAPDEARRRPFAWAPAWTRPVAAAAAICLGLTALTVLIGGNHATARPLRIRAEAGHSGWTFVYRGPDGRRTRESSLYLAKGRRAVVRIVRPLRHPHPIEVRPASGRRWRAIRVDPAHRGALPLTYGPGRTAFSAQVLGPKRFRAQLDASADRRAVGA